MINVHITSLVIKGNFTIMKPSCFEDHLKLAFRNSRHSQQL